MPAAISILLCHVALPAPHLMASIPTFPALPGLCQHHSHCRANGFGTRPGTMPHPPAHPYLLSPLMIRITSEQGRGREERLGCPPLQHPTAGGTVGSQPSLETPRASLSPSSAGCGVSFLPLLPFPFFLFFCLLKKKQFLSRKHLRSQVNSLFGYWFSSSLQMTSCEATGTGGFSVWPPPPLQHSFPIPGGP